MVQSGSTHSFCLDQTLPKPEWPDLTGLPICIWKALTNIVVGSIPRFLRPAGHGKAPYKAVLTHGFVLDEQGRKHPVKSLGGVVDPNEVMGTLGMRISCVCGFCLRTILRI